MITIHYLEGVQHKKQSFNVSADEYMAVMKLLREHKYNWYTVDKGSKEYDPNQLTLDFGEIQ